MNLAVKDIRRHIGRFAATMVGIGLLVSVVLTMNGIYRGNISDGLWLINAANADLWVVEAGRGGPFNEQSKIPESTYRRIAAVPGVAIAAPFLSFTVHRKVHNQERQFSIVGYDIRSSLGAPASVQVGRPIRNAHFEMVADAKLGLRVGEKLRLGLHDYSVVGVLKHAVDSAGLPLVYLSLHDAQRVFFQTDNQAIRSKRAELLGEGETSPASSSAQELASLSVINAVLVRLSPAANPRHVTESIERWMHLGVLSGEHERELMLKGKLVPITAPLVIFRLLLVVVCTVIMTLVIYVFTMDKQKSLATMRLLGTPTSRLVRLVLDQALILALGGFAVGWALVTSWRDVFPRTLVFIPSDTVLTLCVILFGGLVAGAIGVRHALKADPSQALGT